MGNFFGDVYNGIANTLKNLAHESVDAVASAFSGTVNAIKNAANATKNVAIQAASEISLVLTNAVKLLISGLQILLTDFGKLLPGIVMDAIKGLGNLRADMASTITGSGYSYSDINVRIPSLENIGK